MKINYQVVAVIFATLIAFSSCKKNEETAPAPVQTDSTKKEPVEEPKKPVGETPTKDVPEMSFAEILYSDAGTIKEDKKITGIVITKQADKNFPSNQLAIQNGDLGVVIKFDASHDYKAGDKVEVLVKDANLQIKGTEYRYRIIEVAKDDKVSKVGTGEITPKVVGPHDLYKEKNQAILVKIHYVDLLGPASTVFNDGSEELHSTNVTVFEMGHGHPFKINVFKDATFAGESIPKSQFTISGISLDAQLYPRDKADAIQ